MERHVTIEKNRGRTERRICRKLADLFWLESWEQWSGSRCVFSIEHAVETGGTRSREISYSISSLDASAERLVEIAREHWKIESMHWTLDVTFSEDSRRFLSENTHKTLNSLHKFALAVHKNFLLVAHKKSSVKASVLSCLTNPSLLCNIMEIL